MTEQTLENLIDKINSTDIDQDRSKRLTAISSAIGQKLLLFCEKESIDAIESSTTKCLITNKDAIVVVAIALINVLFSMLKNTKSIDVPLTMSLILYMAQRTKELNG